MPVGSRYTLFVIGETLNLLPIKKIFPPMTNTYIVGQKIK